MEMPGYVPDSASSDGARAARFVELRDCVQVARRTCLGLNCPMTRERVLDTR